jgi:quinol-cytochrome oxidoreductase complex cytochrome b subunit
MIGRTGTNGKYPWVFFMDTFGGLAISSLIICIVSGVILSVPFNVYDPYASISSFILVNPGATIARNMHYWSAQLFLVFTVVHMWDHFRISTEKGIRTGPWLRLVLGILVIFYAMLSGFILKGDVDSEQASNIFRSLFDSIPLIGTQLSLVLLGKEGSYLLLYVNHIAIATIFIIAIQFEHSRALWGKALSFIILSLLILVLSLLFQAPLHDGQSNLIKGPWYFLGLQEILHWMSRPAWIWLVLAALFVPLFFLPYVRPKGSSAIKYFLFIAFLFYALLTIIGYFFRGEEWKWTWTGDGIHMPFKPVPLYPGTFKFNEVSQLATYQRAESCMLCHEGMSGFSPSHDPEAIGCVSCHLGNPFTPDKDNAHAGMLRVPGNLDNAARSCGTANCHPEITDRIHTSLMTTMSGIISVDRYVFNELEHPDGLFTPRDIGHSAADQHLRNLCSRCHLGNPKTEPGGITQESRGGGCNACHLNYADQAIAELSEYFGTEMPDSSRWTAHPSIDLNISDNHCFGCHSRSGRISTSYEGWHETLLHRDDATSADTLRVLDDGRVFRLMTADVHHTAGMQCIDCHDSYELMGDGNFYMHEEDQVKTKCEDCHFSGNAVKTTVTDAETIKILQVKGMDYSKLEFLANSAGRVMWNTGINERGEAIFHSKVSHNSHPLSPPADACSRGEAHDRLSCQSCHTAWVPQCIGCHNEYDPRVPAYDMIARREETGGWVEFVGKYLAGRPALGVIECEESRIHTFVPGMVLTIDKSTYDKDIEDPHVFHRLYAPLSAHTTAAEGRDCRSCHNDPVAIGFGHGTLKYHTDNATGRWQFTPRFAANENDGLPEDAWIPFLGEAGQKNSTRTNTRPFSLEEQRRILLVGSCLECHDQDSELMSSTLYDFEAVIKRRSEACVLPDYYELTAEGRR